MALFNNNRIPLWEECSWVGIKFGGDPFTPDSAQLDQNEVIFDCKETINEKIYLHMGNYNTTPYCSP